MKALFKFNDTGRCVVALGTISSHIAEKMAMVLGEAIICEDAKEVAEYCKSSQLACLIIPLGDPEASVCEFIASEHTFDARFLVCSPHDSKQHHAPTFFMVATNFGFCKGVHAVLTSLHWRFWELDQEGQSVHEKYRKIMNRMSDGIVRFNADATVTFANKTFNKWANLKNTAGLTADDLFDEGAAMAMRLCVSHLRHGVMMPFTVVLKTGVMLSLDPTPRFQSNGEYDGMLALLRLRDVNNEQHQREYEESRTTVYLTSLSMALNKTFELDQIVRELIDAVRRLCGKCAIGVLIEGEEPVIDSDSIPLTIDISEVMAKFCGRLESNKNIRVVKDLTNDSEPIVDMIKELHLGGAVCFSLHVNDERLGCVWVLLSEKIDSMRERGSMLINTGVQVGMAIRNAINIRTMLREQSERRRFYSDALAAVTNNKLILCEYDELDKYWKSCPGQVKDLALIENRDVPESRHLIADMLAEHGVPDNVSFGMVTCVSEAATNVVKYGPPGKMSAKVSGNYVRVRFDDRGQGIAVNKLPKAILASGYSESLTPSLGLGFSVMLKLCTSLRIATGSKGTYLLLEMEIEKEEVDPIANFVTFV